LIIWDPMMALAVSGAEQRESAGPPRAGDFRQPPPSGDDALETGGTADGPDE
jgi:hypothetical protein